MRNCGGGESDGVETRRQRCELMPVYSQGAPFYCYYCHKALQLTACSRHEKFCWCDRNTSLEGPCFDLGHCNLLLYQNS
jgi:hypothetical protein